MFARMAAVLVVAAGLCLAVDLHPKPTPLARHPKEEIRLFRTTGIWQIMATQVRTDITQYEQLALNSILAIKYCRVSDLPATFIAMVGRSLTLSSSLRDGEAWLRVAVTLLTKRGARDVQNDETSAWAYYWLAYNLANQESFDSAFEAIESARRRAEYHFPSQGLLLVELDGLTAVLAQHTDLRRSLSAAVSSFIRAHEIGCDGEHVAPSRLRLVGNVLATIGVDSPIGSTPSVGDAVADLKIAQKQIATHIHEAWHYRRQYNDKDQVAAKEHIRQGLSTLSGVNARAHRHFSPSCGFIRGLLLDRAQLLALDGSVIESEAICRQLLKGSRYSDKTYPYHYILALILAETPGARDEALLHARLAVCDLRRHRHLLLTPGLDRHRVTPYISPGSLLSTLRAEEGDYRGSIMDLAEHLGESAQEEALLMSKDREFGITLQSAITTEDVVHADERFLKAVSQYRRARTALETDDQVWCELLREVDRAYSLRDSVRRACISSRQSQTQAITPAGGLVHFIPEGIGVVTWLRRDVLSQPGGSRDWLIARAGNEYEFFSLSDRLPQVKNKSAPSVAQLTNAVTHGLWEVVWKPSERKHEGYVIDHGHRRMITARTLFDANRAKVLDVFSPTIAWLKHKKVNTVLIANVAALRTPANTGPAYRFLPYRGREDEKWTIETFPLDLYLDDRFHVGYIEPDRALGVGRHCTATSLSAVPASGGFALVDTRDRGTVPTEAMEQCYLALRQSSQTSEWKELIGPKATRLSFDSWLGDRRQATRLSEMFFGCHGTSESEDGRTAFRVPLSDGETLTVQDLGLLAAKTSPLVVYAGMCSSFSGPDSVRDGTASIAQHFFANGTSYIVGNTGEVEMWAMTLLYCRFRHGLQQAKGQASPVTAVQEFAKAKKWLRRLRKDQIEELVASLSGPRASYETFRQLAVSYDSNEPVEFDLGDTSRPYSHPMYWHRMVLIVNGW